MTGATICSGILAPETATPEIDWLWCAEIEPFPCSVIAHHHLKLPNLGDITSDDFIDRAKQLGPLGLLVAGTPCQAFSVAGLRKSLQDSRGNLTLRLVELVHAIRPGILLWENVPGVLSTPDNAFGCFLAGLVGADEAIAPAAGWTSAGVVTGPLGTAAWRILDAQYFGLAQRRARLFLIFRAGDETDPAEVLFEFESLRRDFAPRREARQDVTGTLSARTEGGGGLGTDFDLGGERSTVPALTSSARGISRPGESRGQDPVIPMFRRKPNGGAVEVATAVNAHGGVGRMDFESETFVTGPLQAMAVRRLTPEECETLQGFPRGYTDIPHRGKKAADGPRYRALGNSMAVPVLAWIQKRILALSRLE